MNSLGCPMLTYLVYFAREVVVPTIVGTVFGGLALVIGIWLVESLGAFE